MKTTENIKGEVVRLFAAEMASLRAWCAVEGGEALVWFWIGTHAEYDKLIQ